MVWEDVQRKNHLLKYGFTQKTFELQLADQNGRCAICRTDISGFTTFERDGEVYNRMKAFIDHDHETGMTRELLCHGCNAGLGLFKDSIRNLASAIVYLEEHGKKY